MRRFLLSLVIVAAGAHVARANDPDLVRQQIELVRQQMHLDISIIGNEAQRRLSQGASGVETSVWQRTEIDRVGANARAAVARLMNGPTKVTPLSPNRLLLVGVWRSSTRLANGVVLVRDLSIDQNCFYSLSVTAVAPNGATALQGTAKGQFNYYEDGVTYLASFRGASQCSRLEWGDQQHFNLTTGANVSTYQKVR